MTKRKQPRVFTGTMKVTKKIKLTVDYRPSQPDVGAVDMAINNMVTRQYGRPCQGCGG